MLSTIVMDLHGENALLKATLAERDAEIVELKKLVDQLRFATHQHHADLLTGGPRS